MTKVLRIGIIAGESSGDNLGADLMRVLQQRNPDTVFEGIGGPAMLARGFHSFFPMERLSVMGFVEPLGRLPELLRIDKTLRQHFLAQPPDLFIGIDSPGFNLRFEEALHQGGIRTAHYVSPSVWAYREKRIHRIKRAVDLMLVLFPFETAIYETHGVPVEYVGHPLADSIGFEDQRDAARQQLQIDPQGTVIALLPGSRANELKRLGPVFLQTAKALQQKTPGLRFILPCAGPERYRQMQAMLAQENCTDQVQLLDGQAQTAMSAADLVLMSSGTATLEAMLLNRPMVICYKLAPLTYALASRMVKIPHVGLPNLLAQKALVPEFLQHAVTVENLQSAIERMLADDAAVADLQSEFRQIHQQLRCQASERAADAVLRLCGS